MKIKHCIIGIIIIVIDQITKYLIINRNITIIPSFFEFTYTKNLGGAFGIGTQAIVLILSSLIIIGIIIYLIKERNVITNYLPYVLILSGSISNFGDRLFRGYVIDFIDINIFNFPNFNIADISIVLGVFNLIILILCKSNEKNKN